MLVTRCVCHNVSLVQLRQMARDEQCGYDDLTQRTRCGTGCGLCRPYIARMLQTGETRQPLMSPDEARKWERVIQTLESRSAGAANGAA